LGISSPAQGFTRGQSTGWRTQPQARPAQPPKNRPTFGPEAAAALVDLASDAIFDGVMGRTRTNFPSGASRTSHALAQGCSSSPTMCNVALAATCEPNAPQPAGVVRLSAHDDFQATIMPGAGMALDDLRPPNPGGGSRYNTSKSVAVGPRAQEAVDAGIAAAASPYMSVFGAPVGDVHEWVLNVWRPRWDKRVKGLLKVFEVAPDVAIMAAVSLGGPGAAASHWQSHAPAFADPRIVLIMEDVDLEWVNMFIAMTGVDPCALRRDAPRLVAAVADRIFGSGPACLGHRSAREGSEANYWRGLRVAWPTMMRLASSASISLPELAEAALVPAGVPVDRVAAWIARQDESAAADLVDLRLSYATRCSGDSSRLAVGARASADAHDAGYPNLRVQALRPSRWVRCGALSSNGRGGVIALAQLFGVPMWQALGVAPPSQCRRCQAPAVKLMGGSGTLELLQQQPQGGVRASLDDEGEHVAACQKGGPLAGAKKRHDDVARALAHISAECGRDGRYHDGPVFSFGQKSRPADWIEGNMCHDLNQGARRVMTVANREKGKVAKYAEQMRLHPHLMFRPFAVDNGGEVGPQAAQTMGEWARSLAAARKTAGFPTGNPSADVCVAVGRAFVRAAVAQVYAWAGVASRVVT
jgi:hypothetical protein